MELFTKLNQDGTTIIQVTHSEVNASYGRRVIQLRDGWIVKAWQSVVTVQRGTETGDAPVCQGATRHNTGSI